MKRYLTGLIAAVNIDILRLTSVQELIGQIITIVRIERLDRSDDRRILGIVTVI